MRKLPIYFLIDNSESMLSGECGEAIKNGLKLLINALRGEPIALETAYLSLITYSEFAIQHNQLTDLFRFKVPAIVPLGKNKSFGAALQLLSYSIENEVVQPTLNEKGDWRPIAIILTDGAPTDIWLDELSELKKNHVNLIIFIAGTNFDFSIYKKMTAKIFRLSATSHSDLYGLFNWETIFPFKDGSVITDDITVQEIKLPPPPTCIDINPEIENTPSEKQNSYKQDAQ